MKIKIEKSGLKNLNSDIVACTEKFKLLVQDLENDTNHLSMFWNEAASVTFFNVIHENYVVKLNTYIQTLEKYSEYLLNSINFYEKLETTFSQKKIDV